MKVRTGCVKQQQHKIYKSYKLSTSGHKKMKIGKKKKEIP